MEVVGVKRSLEKLTDSGFQLSSVTADRNRAVSKMLTDHTTFKNIPQWSDFWHVMKGIKSELRLLVKVKKNASLIPWRFPIINHLYSIFKRSAAERDDTKRTEIIQEEVRGLLYHIMGKHAWPKVR